VASKFLRVDEHALFVIAALRDLFWRTPDAALAAEIRLQEARFGLDPLARRRLGWEIHDGPAPAPEQPEPPEAEPPDPRKVLSMVRRPDGRSAV
jgi:hypothetical protein